MTHYKRTVCNDNRLYKRLCNLLFFVCLLAACQQQQGRKDLLVASGNTSVFIPEAALPGNYRSDIYRLRIRRRGISTDMLGSYLQDDGILFKPLIPFEPNTTYEYWFDGKLRDSFRTAPVDTTPPFVLFVYPGTGKVPVNLLKFYLVFSKPMRESVSDRYLRLVNGKDTLKNVFLNLQPELWNQQRTMLTVWLDPGRIKRDLQPNKRLGAPLEENNTYRLVIKQGWPTAKGGMLNADSVISWTTTIRDSLSPDPFTWRLKLPGEGTTENLSIDFGEVLDPVLLAESLQILSANGTVVRGGWSADPGGGEASFTPQQPWKAGDYRLVVDSKLEDLAGNNLNRPFDRDITTTKARPEQASYTRPFTIRK